MIFYRTNYEVHKTANPDGSGMMERTPNVEPPTPTSKVLYVDGFSSTTGCCVVWVDEG